MEDMEKLENIGDQKLNIDQETYDLCMDKLREIYKIVNLINCETEFSELGNGLPSLLVGYNTNETFAAFLITFIPLNLNGNFRLIAQFGASVIEEELPEDKREEVEKVMRFFATTLNMSTPVLTEKGAMLKYLMYVNHEEPIDQMTVLKTMEIMAFESDDLYREIMLIKKGRATAEDVINGTIDIAEELLKERSSDKIDEDDEDDEDY